MELDTICAISTPLGLGGIGIIRISGKHALLIGESIFRSKKNIQRIKPYHLHHGYIVSSQGEIIDEVLVSYMPSPGSYTGEDVFEINCHGGPVVVQKILKEVISKGARLAQAGEFTMRAFLNGKMDLSQAEAVCELISSKAEAAMHIASKKLHGALKKKIDNIKQGLEHIMAQLLAHMDFEEEIDIDYLEIKQKTSDLLDETTRLIKNHDHYSVFVQGAKVVLCGEVNAGKSSILNAILGRERAIVTPVPGTTRDYIEDTINIHGIPTKIIDTAGIRTSDDEIEIIGVNKGRELIKEGDIICLIFDVSSEPSQEVIDLINLKPKDKIICVANKIDLPTHKKISSLLKELEKKGIDIVYTCAKTGEHIDRLVNTIGHKLLGRGIEPPEGDIVPNIRQAENLKQAKQELNDFIRSLDQGVEIDLIYTHLESASRYLSEITGEISTEDVLDKVFSNFCIGK